MSAIVLSLTSHSSNRINDLDIWLKHLLKKLHMKSHFEVRKTPFDQVEARVNEMGSKLDNDVRSLEAEGVYG